MRLDITVIEFAYLHSSNLRQNKIKMVISLFGKLEQHLLCAFFSDCEYTLSILLTFCMQARREQNGPVFNFFFQIERQLFINATITGDPTNI